MARVKVDLSNAPRKIKSTVNNVKVGLFVASTCEKYMNTYVPMDTGMLSQNTTIQPFRVIYNTEPYATYIYHGAGLNFNKEKHPLATAYWDKAMLSARKNDISRQVSDYLRKGGF